MAGLIISIWDCVEVSILLIFFLGRPAVPDNSCPDGGAHSSSLLQVTVGAHSDDLIMTDSAKKDHNSSSPLSTQTHGHNHDLTTVPNNEVCSSSPISQPTDCHDKGPDVIDLGSEACGSSLPLPAESHGNSTTPTSAQAHGTLGNPAITVQRDSDIVTQGMKALSKCVIEGVGYDCSLCGLPHPRQALGTRVQLREEIIVWFQDEARDQALLWLNGRAGVGKSVIIQTVAESLAESNRVGATFFFSRLNGHNNPQRAFIAIAFQLATGIPAYKIYITEQMALDSRLLGREIEDLFRVFITEPFGNKGIGKGEGPWAVLLDGLDDCEGVYEQCEIVRLVGGFVLNFPNAPLVWVIASRPEPYITATFKDETVASSYWSKYVPVASVQACRDVKHYLEESFKDIRKLFPHLPSNWPSENQFQQLTRGALGHFAFARTAVRFMEDPNHADPVSQLDWLLSILDYVESKISDDRPFALLDALYTRFLVSIPPSMWRTTKRILGFFICIQSVRTKGGLSYPLDSENCTPLGASIILGLELDVINASLHKLYPVLNVSDSNGAHRSRVKFIHVSFVDYLADRARSKDYYIDLEESVDDVTGGTKDQPGWEIEEGGQKNVI